MSGTDTKSNNKNLCLNCKGKNWLIQCECGTCQDVIFRFHSNGLLRRYAYNHHFRLAKNKRDQRGEKNSMYKGGRYFDDGYWMLTGKHDHPNSQKSDGAIPEHVYNFTVREGKLFCCMLPGSIVHHKNHIKTDNRLQNLEGMVRTKHIAHHKKKDLSDRICLLCSSKTTYMKDGKYAQWRKYENGFVCMNCYMKIYDRKKLGS